MSKKPSQDQVEREVEDIARYITHAKAEIAAIASQETATAGGKNIASASLELTEVVRHTEEATNAIMDNAEAIMQLAAGMSDVASSAKINAHAISVLEACSFQDITGQRIKKVLKTLEQIEFRIGNLVKLFGGTLPEGYQLGEIETSTRRPDEDLLNGPQLSGAPNQDDVDKLFASS